MVRRLPPLYPLRAFEAAARLNSFSAAARELSLTQSAVSHEVKALETYFGTALFRRTRSGLILTRRGQQVFAIARDAFEDLSGLGTESDNRALQGTVTIAAPPLFCAHWLLPRIDRFAWANPGVTFRILNVTEDRPELMREVDIAIIWNDRIPSGHDGVKLISAAQTPIASPALIATNDLVEPRELLRQHRILHEGNTQDWRNWCEFAGIDPIESINEWVFDDPALMIEACMRGHGVALGTLPLIDSLMSEGRLVPLFRQAMPASNNYFLTRSDPPSAGRAPQVIFTWLRGFSSELTCETADAE